MDLLPMALQVGDAAEGDVAVWAREARLPSAVKPQSMVFVLGQGAERQLAFCATFYAGGRRSLFGLNLSLFINYWLPRWIRFVRHLGDDDERERLLSLSDKVQGNQSWV